MRATAGASGSRGTLRGVTHGEGVAGDTPRRGRRRAGRSRRRRRRVRGPRGELKESQSFLSRYLEDLGTPEQVCTWTLNASDLILARFKLKVQVLHTREYGKVLIEVRCRVRFREPESAPARPRSAGRIGAYIIATVKFSKG